MNLKKSADSYGRFWREEREKKDVVIKVQHQQKESEEMTQSWIGEYIPQLLVRLRKLFLDEKTRN